MADGTYTLVGFTTPSDFNKDQVVIGNFYIESQTSDLPAFNIGNGTYDKSNANRQEVYAQATSGGVIGRVTGVEISGPTGSKILSSGEYTIHGDASNPGYVTISRDVLDTLNDGKYYFILYASSGLATIQKNVGEFTITSGDLGEGFSIGNNPYDKSQSPTALEIYAQPQSGGVVGLITGVAISGPVNKALSSSEYYVVGDSSTPGYVAIKRDYLDTLPEGTYNFILTVKSGAASTQITAGQFTVKSSAVDSDFSIANSPYDKNSTDSKAVGAVPKTTGVVASITGVAISGPETRTLTSSEYYKQADNGDKPGYVVILKDVLDKLPDGTYNFLVTITSGTSSVQKNAGQFVVKTGTIDFGEFEITGTPFDKNADAPADVVATAKENGRIPSCATSPLQASAASPLPWFSNPAIIRTLRVRIPSRASSSSRLIS